MNIDPNIVMAIIAFSAVISPTISTYLNNRHQLKIEKLKLFEKCKYDAIENFTKSVEFYYYQRTFNELWYFRSAAQLLCTSEILLADRGICKCMERDRMECDHLFICDHSNRSFTL